MRRLTSVDRLTILPSQARDATERLTDAEAEWSAWTVSGDVKVGGSRSIALALAVGRDARWPVLPYRLPFVGTLLEGVYRLVARNRHRLPGEQPWCLEHPDECHPAAGSDG